MNLSFHVIEPCYKIDTQLKQRRECDSLNKTQPKAVACVAMYVRATKLALYRKANMGTAWTDVCYT